ncbi:MAG: 30S ribosomal protein S5 [Candidatus Paceibacterota bacterium]
MIKKEEKSKKGGFNRGKKREKSEFDQKVIDIARVTRVVKGGKRFSFRTTVVIGDKKGRVGVGVAKGPDMKVSTEKSFAQAKKNLVKVNLKGTTIPYQVEQKVGSAKVLLKPAVKGRGVVAGGAVRAVMSLVGISDITGKMLGSKNKLSNARATIKALEIFSIKTVGELKQDEKKKVEKQIDEVKAETVLAKTEVKREIKKTTVKKDIKNTKSVESVVSV